MCHGQNFEVEQGQMSLQTSVLSFLVCWRQSQTGKSIEHDAAGKSAETPFRGFSQSPVERIAISVPDAQVLWLQAARRLQILRVQNVLKHRQDRSCK